MPLRKKIYRSADHASSILESLYQSQAHYDVTLVVIPDQRRFNVHRGVLSVGSEYFDAMFSGSFKESQLPEVPITDVDPEVLELLVKFLYSGSIEIKEEIILDLLKSANLFKMFKAEEFCWSFLLDSLEPGNCLEIRSLAEVMGSVSAFRQANEFIKTNFNEVKEQEDFLKLDLAAFSRFVSADDLEVKREEEVVDAVLSWIKFNPEVRQNDFGLLLKLIRLPLVKPETILEILEPLCKDPEATSYISEGFKWHCMPSQRPFFSNQNCRQRRNIGGKILFVNIADYLLTIQPFSPVENIWSTNLVFKAIPDVGCPKGIWKDSIVFVNKEGSVRFYQMASKRWESLKSIPGVKKDFGTAILNGNLYLTGGPQSRVVVRFDFLSRKLYTQQPMTTCRSLSACVAFKGLLYVIGGRKEGDSSLAVQTEAADEDEDSYDYVYDDGDDDNEPPTVPPPAPVQAPNPPPNQAPNRPNEQPNVRQSPDLVPVVESLGSVESFDFRRNKWTTRASLVTSRINPIAVVSKGQIFVFGGQTGEGNYVRSVEKYDPESDTWTVLIGLEENDGEILQGASLDDRIFLMKKVRDFTRNEEFIPEKMAFKLLKPMEDKNAHRLHNASLVVESN